MHCNGPTVSDPCGSKNDHSALLYELSHLLNSQRDKIVFFLERMPEKNNWEIFLWPIKCNLQSILNIRNLCRACRISSIQISGL